MAKSKQAPGEPDEEWGKRQRHRVHALGSLLAICRQFERLQTPGEARQACAEVAVFLNNALIQEQISANLRQKKTWDEFS